jgi:hypothetical protein
MSEYLSTLHADRLIDMHGSILRGFLFFYLLRCGPLFCLAPMSGRLTDTLVIVSPFSLSLFSGALFCCFTWNCTFRHIRLTSYY